MLEKQQPERRSEPRIPAGDHCYVEFKFKNMGPIYQFKIWDISDHGLCLLAGDGSKILEKLAKGDILTMDYHNHDTGDAPLSITAKVAHLTKKETGKFKGHYLIGLAVIP